MQERRPLFDNGVFMSTLGTSVPLSGRLTGGKCDGHNNRTKCGYGPMPNRGGSQFEKRVPENKCGQKQQTVRFNMANTERPKPRQMRQQPEQLMAGRATTVQVQAEQ